MKEVRVKTLQDTYDLASRVASLLPSSALITMSGDLGAGKTTFTKGLAKAMGITKTVTSPTFTILKSYEENGAILHHIDAYRLEGVVQDLGFEEVFEEKAVCVVEWAEFIEYVLPKDRLEITITLDGEYRIFKFTFVGSAYEKMAKEMD